LTNDRSQDAEWLEWSGLPRALNQVRAGGWLVFKKLVDLDCRRHRRPATVELSVGELAERCGLSPDAAGKIAEALRRKKYIRCFLPEHADEAALFEIRVPLATPLAPDEVARRARDPLLRDPGLFRYAREADEPPEHLARVQAVVDLYLNYLSTKINSFVMDQIEIAARRFPLEAIRATVERGARHEMRTMGWVLKELIRDAKKKVEGKREKVEGGNE
jgi:hypothetical protein